MRLASGRQVLHWSPSAVRGRMPVPYGGGDPVTHSGGPDSREELALGGWRPRDIYIPDLHIGSIRVRRLSAIGPAGAVTRHPLRLPMTCSLTDIDIANGKLD